MAPRRTAAAAEVEQEEPQSQLTKLRFNDTLSWRVGKAIPASELLRRLEKLATELREMEQGEVDTDSLTKVAKELVGQNLIAHKDKGVRAFTACCLVDILKLCAPDAPFTPSQLKVCYVYSEQIIQRLMR
jgi:sister-chromatid-cohesion protein PDS5